MRAAGYVLVGGRSSRMGTDKALLPYGDSTLAQHIAAKLLIVTGEVTLVGDRAVYGHLGYPVIPDRVAGNGPLGGVAAAVSHAQEWALVAACDLPAIEIPLLEMLIQGAQEARASVECVAPLLETGPEPLCALYHRKALPLLDSFLNTKFLVMREVVASLQTQFVRGADPRWFRNVNTPEEYRSA